MLHPVAELSEVKSWLIGPSAPSGQAFTLGLLMLAIGSLLFLTSFCLGQLMFAKLQLSQAVDAAAYAGAVVQARALNAHAYLNRAQLAHQLASAHWVTMASSVKFVSRQAERAARRNPPSWVIGRLFGPQYSGSYLSSQRMLATQGALLVIDRHQASHERQIHQDIAHRRRDLYQTVTQTRREVIEDVLSKNLSGSVMPQTVRSLSELHVSLDIVDDTFDEAVSIGSTQQSEWASWLDQVVRRYGYLHHRDDTAVNWWWVNVKCPIFRPKLRRRGRTQLDEKGLWQANDTLSYHAIKFNRLIGCYEREYPMGWARVEQVTSAGGHGRSEPAMWDFSQRPFWQWFKTFVQLDGISWMSFKNSLADAWAQQSMTQWETKGFAHFAHVQLGRDQPLGFTVVAKQRVFSILGMSIDLMTRARAEAYFEAPDGDGFTSPSSPAHLYHAFWHSKLSTPR